MQDSVPDTDPYNAWVSDPTPDNLNKVVKTLEPSISYAAGSLGAGGDARMKHQARLYAVDAVKTYDPGSGASLTTWAQSKMQKLRRYKRENSGPMKVPDRAQLDAIKLMDFEREFMDANGYDPDVKQLADFSKMSVKRIADVRRMTRPKPSEDQMLDNKGSESEFMGEALEYVYDAADTIDRKIIEYTTGYGGNPLLNKKEIAAKLGIDPSQVTRRSARISSQVTEINTDLEDVLT